MDISRVRHFLWENQISIIFVGILAGIAAPSLFSTFHPFNTLLLQSIFFLSALRIDMRDLWHYARDWKMVGLIVLFMLFLLPIGVYLPVSLLAPEWALPFLVAFAGPTGMTIALIADYFGGKPSLAIVIVVATSLFAPFTIPILMELLVARSVTIDAVAMFRGLADAILFPFLFAFLLQRVSPRKIAAKDIVWRGLSVAAFGLLIASIVSKTMAADGGTSSLDLSARTLTALVISFGFVALLTYGAYRMAFWHTVSDRITIALCMLYMNFTLALYIADEFFTEERIIPQLVVILIVLNAMLPLLKIFAARVVKRSVPVA